MALELRQVEVRSGAAREKLLRVVEEVQREVEDAARDRRAVDPHVLFRQVPTARPHEQHRRPRIQPVRLALGRREVDPPPYRVAEVDVSLDVVVPARCVGILEIRHEDAGAGIERVDDHLAVDRAGDLDAAVDDIGGHRRARPVGVTDRACLRKEFGKLARVELRLARRAAGEEIGATAAEGALQLGREGDRLRRHDLRVVGSDAAGDLDPGPKCPSCSSMRSRNPGREDLTRPRKRRPRRS